MNKGIKFLSLGALVVTLGLNSTQQTFAAEQPNTNKYSLSSEDTMELKTFFSKYEVNNVTQEKLINKFNEGRAWDSLDQNSQPVLTYTVSNDGQKELVSTYKDGSILVSAIDPALVEFNVPEIPTSEKSLKIVKDGPSRAVDPGTVTGGSGYKSYKKAKVYSSSGIVSAYFYANFTIVQGGKDYISSVYDYKLTGIGGTATVDNFRIVRKTETLDNKASAKLDFTFAPFNGTASTTCWLKLFVGGDKYSSDRAF